MAPSVAPATSAIPATSGGADGVTRRLARFVCEAQAQDLPAAVIAEAKRSFLNWTGATLGGCRHPAVEIALNTVAPFSGPPQASLLGRAERLDALHAALLNGTASHVLDFDDTHLRTVIHPSGPVASAILALSEHRGGVSGSAFVQAFVLGIEVECRIGNAVYPSHYDVGWHITGTTGVFGAAAACGKLLGLDEQRLAWALGAAATQASGLREMFGTMCKPLHVGRAAQNGLLAALLAERGFTSSEQAIEAPRGFAHVLASGRDFGAITEGLGQTYEVLQNTYKPFACGIVIHPTIDGCIQLRDELGELGLRAADVERIDLRVAPLVLELTGKQSPRTGLEGKFSVYHSAAVALVDGQAAETQYSDARVADREVVALRDRVRAQADPAVHEAEAHVTITLRDGRTLRRHVRHAIGSVERPMSDDALDTKFRSLAAPVLPAAQVERLIALCRDLDRLPDAAAIAAAAVPAAAEQDLATAAH
jgi:2-methylcitrate dehydratase PrpD